MVVVLVKACGTKQDVPGIEKFSFSKDLSCRINIESQPLLRTMFRWPEGHSVSPECEMNGEMNFTSSNGSWLGLCFAIGISGRKIGEAKAIFLNFSLRLPCMGRFFLEKIIKRVAYEKFKFKDGKDMEVQANLDFIYFD
jgi:hypothetical protein